MSNHSSSVLLILLCILSLVQFSSCGVLLSLVFLLFLGLIIRMLEADYSCVILETFDCQNIIKTVCILYITKEKP